MRYWMGRTAVVLLLLAAVAAPAKALVITQTEPDATWAKAFVQAPVVVNGHIEVGLSEEFYADSKVNSPLTLQFRLEAADAGMDIWIVNHNNGSDPNQSVLNLTGKPWNHFEFLLVNTSSFLPNYCNATLLNPSGVVSDAFGSPTDAGNDPVNNYGYIDYNGPWLFSGSNVDFAGIEIAHESITNGVFYLKEIPAPEPATMALMFVGAGALLTRWRKRTA